VAQWPNSLGGVASSCERLQAAAGDCGPLERIGRLDGGSSRDDLRGLSQLCAMARGGCGHLCAVARRLRRLEPALRYRAMAMACSGLGQLCAIVLWLGRLRPALYSCTMAQEALRSRAMARSGSGQRCAVASWQLRRLGHRLEPQGGLHGDLLACPVGGYSCGLGVVCGLGGTQWLL
jgi:hypothetical protein